MASVMAVEVERDHQTQPCDDKWRRLRGGIFCLFVASKCGSGEEVLSPKKRPFCLILFGALSSVSSETLCVVLQIRAELKYFKSLITVGEIFGGTALTYLDKQTTDRKERKQNRPPTPRKEQLQYTSSPVSLHWCQDEFTACDNIVVSRHVIQAKAVRRSTTGHLQSSIISRSKSHQERHDV